MAGPRTGALFSGLPWSAGTDRNFQHHSYAFAYPALATNACSGEVGLPLQYGGNKKFYKNHVVGFWGDFLVFITTDSSVGTTRFGDYVSLRQDSTAKLQDAYFDGFGFGLDKTTTGTQTDTRYVVFGRDRRPLTPLPAVAVPWYSQALPRALAFQ